MTQEQKNAFIDYLNNLKEGAGHIHISKRKKENYHPDMYGYIKIGGKTYNIAAWKKNNEKQTISIQCSELDIEKI